MAKTSGNDLICPIESSKSARWWRTGGQGFKAQNLIGVVYCMQNCIQNSHARIIGPVAFGSA
jgi:hypothetical protein